MYQEECLSTVAQKKAISENLDNIRGGIDYLEDRIKLLQERLNVILLPDYPTEVGKDNLRPEVSVLACELGADIVRINSCTSKIDNILLRLDF